MGTFLGVEIWPKRKSDHEYVEAVRRNLRQRKWIISIQLVVAVFCIGAIIWMQVVLNSIGPMGLSAGLGFFVGTWLSMRFFPKATFTWILLAVPVVAVVGYLMAGAGTGFADALEPYNQVAVVPASPFARALPIEQIAVGTLATFLARWLGSGPMTSGLEEPG